MELFEFQLGILDILGFDDERLRACIRERGRRRKLVSANGGDFLN
jgi:hypothetical protein